MQLWIAALLCFAAAGLTAAFLLAYRREKKKRFFALAVFLVLLALAAFGYAALTLILVGGTR